MFVLNGVLGYILMLGPLVLLHELGHYLVGRWCGVHAEAFSIGFGRELFGWTDRKGTRWKVSMLPLGGYVKFAGDMTAAGMAIDDIPLSLEERDRCFQFKPLWQRAAIVAAGPVTNILIALVIFAAFNFSFGRYVADPVIKAFPEHSAAQAAGMQVGDRIVAIDGGKTQYFDDVAMHVAPFPGETVRVTVARANAQLTLPVKLATMTVPDGKGRNASYGLLGIQRGDVYRLRYGPVEAVGHAFKQCWDIVDLTVTGLRQIIFGQRSVRELGGPVKIAGVAGEALSMGWLPFVSMAAFISINLAFINLLPIPALDGGHLAFYLVEAVRRKALGARSQEWAFRTGFAFLLALIVFVTINDVVPASLFGQ
jgi:regulator of sigma E protease